MSSFNKLISREILMLILALGSLGILLLEVIGSISPDQEQTIKIIDLSISLIFLLEFIYALRKSKDRKKFFKLYWWELLACIPVTTSSTQVLRIFKIPRALPLIETFRFFRFLVRLRIILSTSERFTKQTYLIYLAAIVGSIILVGALLFYHFENGINPNLHYFGDSIYWAITTMATVGSDIQPSTTIGRFIAVILIFTGIGSLGSFITIIQSYIIKKSQDN